MTELEQLRQAKCAAEAAMDAEHKKVLAKRQELTAATRVWQARKKEFERARLKWLEAAETAWEDGRLR